MYIYIYIYIYIYSTSRGAQAEEPREGAEQPKAPGVYDID